MYPVDKSTSKQGQTSENGNVKVVIRIRPVNEAENNEKHHTVTEAISDHMLVFDPKIQNAPGFLNTNQRDINRRRFKDLKYAFDYVCGPTATNKFVFEQTTKGIVSGVLNGYNCSVFAYGATGAGKTHTMLGNEREPGVIYHTMIDLYKRINEQKDEKMFDVAVSYSEVYNEQVRDLLMPRGNLPIREDKNVGVIIAGLSLHKPKTAEELLHMLHFGNKNRTQHPTDANAESSRSHAVFQVFVNQREKSANVSTEVKMAKMCLVDLAGSERANHTTNRGDRFREGANINRSLLALGNVINALADNKFKGHIPYRDSKLTRLLKDSLGGNCQTVMIAAVSPSSRSFEDTYNTLRYADRAKHIRADLKKNVMSVDFHIANYKKYVQELEKENQELRRAKQKLMESIQKEETISAPLVSPITRQFQERLNDLFKTRKEIRRAQMESEGAKRELKWKVIRKEQAIKRVQLLTASPSVIGKHTRVIERMKKRIAKEEQALIDSSHHVKDHDASIYSTYSSIVSNLNEAKQLPELLDLNVRIHTVESSMYDSHMYLAFVKKMARAQERQSAVNEKLISCLIQLVKKQHDVLHSQDLLNNELKAKYEQCCYLVEERGVAWNSPGSPQDGSNKMEEEEMCISEIIDIQIPKLQVQALRLDTPSKLKADTLPHIKQQPQRVMKPMSAVKPAARAQTVHGLGSGDRNTKTSANCNTHQEEAALCPLTAAEFTNAEGEVIQLKKNCDVNSLEIPNASSDRCPKRQGQVSVKDTDSPLETLSASGMSFGDSVLVPSESMSGEKVHQSKSSGVAKTAGPSSSLPNIGAVPLAKLCLFGRLDSKPVSETPSQTSSTDNLNDTFQVLKPALLNTPCIDSSQRSKLESQTVLRPLPLPHQRPPYELNKQKFQPNEKLALAQKPDVPTEDVGNKLQGVKDNKMEGSSALSPVSKLPIKSCGSTYSSIPWIPRGNERDDKSRRVSMEINTRQGQNKPKSAFSGQVTNRTGCISPLSATRQSPTTSSLNNINTLKSSFLDPPSVREKSRPLTSACCINANNVHSLSTSPKTYADVVKSPVVSKKANMGLSSTLPMTPVLNNWVGEPMEGVMKTPDFNPFVENIITSIKFNHPPVQEVLSSKPGGDALELRQPLRVLCTNTLPPFLQKPVISQSQTSSCDSSTSESTSFKTHLKDRANSWKQRRQHRAMSSNPYSTHNRKNRAVCSLELPKDTDKPDVSENTGISRPNYMQPTFARAQKMLGLGGDGLVRREANNPLSRRTLTNRQPLTLSLSWNKTTRTNTSSSIENTWKI